MNPILEVEPLSDSRWARIEQSLMQRLEEMPLPSREAEPLTKKRVAPRVLALASAAAFAMVAAIALLVVRPWSSVHVSTSRVATEASPSHVTIGDASIDLSPESGIVVREEEHATVLVLEHGEVALRIAPRPKDRPFLVEAGDVHVRVVGTEFSVRRAGVSAVVTVRRGIVEVTARGEVSRLKAGDAWPDDRAALPAPATGSRGAAIAVPGNGNASPAVETLPAPAAGVEASRSVRSSASPRGTAGRSTLGASRASGGSGGMGTARSVTATASAPAPEASEPALPPPALAVAPPQEALPPSSLEPSSQARYEAAEQIERKDPDGALRAYLALARGSDAWAQDALFAAGRLQADRGARADAVKLVEEYLRRFPRGSNAQDARTLREALH